MNTVERISPLISKFKQQIMFLEEREKLFQNIADGLSTSAYTIPKTSHTTLANSQESANSIVTSSPFIPVCSQQNNQPSVVSVSPHAESAIDTVRHLSFPDLYQIPPLTISVANQIEAGVLRNFGPHCQGRQVLIDTVVHDLIKTFNLL